MGRCRARRSPAGAHGPRAERRTWASYQGLLADPAATELLGDGLIPIGSALLPDAPSVILDDVRHGQGAGRDWYGSDGPLDRWWPVALESWRAALRARAEARAAAMAAAMTAIEPTAVGR